MLIIISNIIEIREPTKEILDYCKKQLVYSNPDYIKKQRMGFWMGRTPKTIKLYELYDGNIYLPLGCFKDIFRMYSEVE